MPNVLRPAPTSDNVEYRTEYLRAPARGGNGMATATTEPVRLPPGPRVPKTVQGIAFLLANHGMFAALGRRYGSAITVNLPICGQVVVISDPILVKEVFSTSSDLIERPTYGVAPSTFARRGRATWRRR